MTTTAQSFVGPEAPATDDAMDLHTDNDYGLGDGDIDLDIEPTTDMYHPEDDVLSLQDAGTDGGVDLHTASGDHDDFMVDKEDVIEEDEIDYGDLEIGDAGQPSYQSIVDADSANIDPPDSTNADRSIHQEETVEEDLIDYSDDEVEQSSKVIQQVQQTQPVDEEAKDWKGQEPGENRGDVGHIEEVGDGEAESYNQTEGRVWDDTTQTKWEEETTDQYPTTSNTNLEHYAGIERNADEGYDIAKADESGVDIVGEATKGDDQLDYQEDEDEDEEEVKNQEFHPANQEQHTHPITINYDGSEFWLFKQDNGQDGEWLLHDASLASKPIYDLFNACRAQLADDINSDTELGFRFDHFHALSVYEDSTACAVTSLQDLLELYLELHAQDGNNEPDSFFITLQFRPRVVSLIGELKKAVQDQIGFSGWNNQIATGQTIFTSSYSHEHTEEYQEQWEGDRVNDQGQDATQAAEAEDDHGAEDDRSVNKDDPDDDTASNESPAGDSASSKPTPGAEEVSPHRSNSEGVSDEASPEEEEEDAEEDIVDYSDDEGQSDTAPHGEKSVNDGSTDSSTVEGDDASYAAPETEDHTNLAESYDTTKDSENDEEDSIGSGHDEQDTADGGNADSHAQYDEGANANDDDEYPYDDLDRGYDQGYPLDNTAQAFGANDYPIEGLNQSGDNYYYEDTNTGFYEQDEFALVAGASEQHDFNAQDNTGQAPAEDELAGVDDFLDLTGAPEENDTEDPFADFANDDIEDDDRLKDEGASLQAPVAASPAASPVVDPLSGLEDLGSPQGLKRSIDKVDVGHVDASDPADIKRQKL